MKQTRIDFKNKSQSKRRKIYQNKNNKNNNFNKKQKFVNEIKFEKI